MFVQLSITFQTQSKCFVTLLRLLAFILYYYFTYLKKNYLTTILETILSNTELFQSSMFDLKIILFSPLRLTNIFSVKIFRMLSFKLPKNYWIQVLLYHHSLSHKSFAAKFFSFVPKISKMKLACCVNSDNIPTPVLCLLNIFMEHNNLFTLTLILLFKLNGFNFQTFRRTKLQLDHS